jgi:predicted metalloprotease with PDZ domain
MTQPGLLSTVLLLLGPPTAQAPAEPIVLEVDATDAARRLFHAHMTIPARAGPLTLLYPKWIPGEHAPDGPIVAVAGLKLTSGGRVLAWRRDLEDVFTFHVDVPAGATAIEAALDLLSPPESEGFSAGASATANLAVVSWNQLLLYPAGARADQQGFRASLRLPAGWSFGTALPLAGGAAAAGPPGEIRFAPATLERLVDSPVIAGAHYKRIDLGVHDGLPHFIDAAADSAAALDLKPELEGKFGRLIVEAGKLFGARHYRGYHFLLSLSDHVAHFGLEHNESSDDRIGEGGITEPGATRLFSGLLPHEYVHSWNGKYRRPAGLATPDYQKPMHGDLLWVYEGLTQYLGFVLTGRSGLNTYDESREALALVAGYLDQRQGRAWRPLQDTADAASILYFAPPYWSDWRRGTDFYDEGLLLWLEADVTIRRLTKGEKSLDDFTRLFYGGPGGQPAVVPYTFDELVSALNQVAPSDWRAFFDDRLHAPGVRGPLGGVEGSGWKLTITDKKPELLKLTEQQPRFGGQDLRYSVGLMLGKEGAIVDVVHDGPAYQAGLGPGMKLIAVNGRGYTAEVMNAALRLGKDGAQTLELLAENTGYYKTYAVRYAAGERYPQLMRDDSRPDVLQQILAPAAR